MKFNRIDIGSLQRKHVQPRKVKYITRQVQAEQKKFPKQALSPKILGFTASVLILVMILQGFMYLGDASNAKGKILGDATSAYTQLNSASDSLKSQNFAEADNLFNSALSNIHKAQDQLNNFKVLEWLTPQANSAQHILVGAGFLAEGGQKLTKALDLFNDFKLTGDGLTDFNQKISANKDLLVEARALIVKSSDEFNSVTSVPADYQETLQTAKSQISELSSVLDTLISTEDLYLTLFMGVKTYLLVFENYDEARATGGFIGTFGVLKTINGNIENLKIESVYNLDGSLTTQIAAPGPFQPAIKKWGMRDANWFADFPLSAQKILNFFELGRETADGVIAMTPKTFVDLLTLTGPIEMPQYGTTLTAENFQEMVQFKTSVDYDKTLNQPKQFLNDFAPVLLDRLSKLDKNDWISVIQILYNNLSRRQIVMYANDASAQTMIDKLGYSGKILDTDFDYLSINNSNLGGTKTDLQMVQKAQLNSKVLSDGTVMNTLQIVRTNNDDAENRDYLRILVPLGSQFVSATGFDDYTYYKSESAGLETDADLSQWDQGVINSNVLIHKESGKAEFSGWVDTKPQDSRTITITYILPFKIQFNSFDSVEPYSILVQKQTGSNPYELSVVLNLGNIQTRWTSSDATFSSNSNTDDFWALVLTK